MNYPSDLSDAQWETIRPWLEYTNGYGNRRQHPLRLMINAILYRVKTGCQWRQLPHDFPNWKSVYSYDLRLCRRGAWEKFWTKSIADTGSSQAATRIPPTASLIRKA
mgnify:CR=1 FL=1